MRRYSIHIYEIWYNTPSRILEECCLRPFISHLFPLRGSGVSWSFLCPHICLVGPTRTTLWNPPPVASYVEYVLTTFLVPFPTRLAKTAPFIAFTTFHKWSSVNLPLFLLLLDRRSSTPHLFPRWSFGFLRWIYFFILSLLNCKHVLSHRGLLFHQYHNTCSHLVEVFPSTTRFSTTLFLLHHFNNSASKQRNMHHEYFNSRIPYGSLFQHVHCVMVLVHGFFLDVIFNFLVPQSCIFFHSTGSLLGDHRKTNSRQIEKVRYKYILPLSSFFPYPFNF